MLSNFRKFMYGRYGVDNLTYFILIAKRSEENRMYMNFYSEIKKRFYKLKGGMIERKDFHIYKCKSCGQKIRIPKGKGKIMVICPKCKNEFVKHS